MDRLNVILFFIRGIAILLCGLEVYPGIRRNSTDLKKKLFKITKSYEWDRLNEMFFHKKNS